MERRARQNLRCQPTRLQGLPHYPERDPPLGQDVFPGPKAELALHMLVKIGSQQTSLFHVRGLPFQPVSGSRRCSKIQITYLPLQEHIVPESDRLTPAYVQDANRDLVSYAA